jgi:hypothetical protein
VWDSEFTTKDAQYMGGQKKPLLSQIRIFWVLTAWLRGGGGGGGGGEFLPAGPLQILVVGRKQEENTNRGKIVLLQRRRGDQKEATATRLIRWRTR